MRKVIVADDDVDAAESLSQVLRLDLLGEVEVVVVHDGAQALTAALRPSAPSAVILDIDMPRMSGIAVATEIRRSPREASAATLVAMSGDDNLLARAEATALFQAVLRKPINMERLLQSILAPKASRRPQVC